MAEVSFEYVQHLVTVPVTVNDVETRFVLDSGIGLTLVSTEVAGATGCRPTGKTFTGRRMSGQDVTLPLARASSISFGGIEELEVDVGILDMSSFPEDLAGIEGFLSLAWFAKRPFTVDYWRRAVVVETPESLAQRRAEGVALPLDVERDGPSLTVFLPLTIPGGRSISVEVDMGSDVLILDERFADETGAPLEGEDVRRVEGTDETGGHFVRTFTRLPGRIHPPMRRNSLRTSPRCSSSGSSTTASSATRSSVTLPSRSMLRPQKSSSHREPRHPLQKIHPSG